MPSTTTENLRHLTIEHSVIERILQGDTEAFAKLYDKYATIMHGVILKIVIDKKTAENVLQQTFMRFWMEMGTFDTGKESLLIWMLNITRNTAFSAVSQKDKNERIQHPDISVNTLNPVITPVKIGADIDSPYTEAQNPALELVYFKGYSLTRAAHELNITAADLKKRIRMEFKKQGGTKSNG